MHEQVNAEGLCPRPSSIRAVVLHPLPGSMADLTACARAESSRKFLALPDQTRTPSPDVGGEQDRRVLKIDTFSIPGSLCSTAAKRVICA